ncbi:hypothetical protein SAMN05216276_101077 [Streptosporangium subroseum]|uniref:PT repeat-containing protein n=1 Tax=Streptosporangium subroseum TaxID=106412 RepID=A0A239EUT4_9ACTN|nr:hypothetical protein SAMN05216276_101077 [Streptosporangium subroseum]
MPAAGAAPAQSAGPGGQDTAYAECLQKNGVSAPSARPVGDPSARPRPTDGSSGGPGAGRGGDEVSPERQKAMQACASLRPTNGSGSKGGSNNSAMQAFRTCMKDNGAELLQGVGAQGLDESDPKVTKALEACGSLRPTSGGSGE